MCNLIHEEIISHPITGCQEDQVRSVLLPSFLSSLIDETISAWAPRYTKNPMLRQVRSQKKNKKNKKKKKKRYLAYLRYIPYQPSHLTSNA